MIHQPQLAELPREVPGFAVCGSLSRSSDSLSVPASRPAGGPRLEGDPGARGDGRTGAGLTDTV